MELPRWESLGSFVETEIRRLSLVRNGDRVADVKCEAEIGEKQILGSVAVKIEATGDEAEACDVGSLVNRASSALDIGIGDNGGRGDSDSDGQSSSSDSSSLSSSSSDSSSSDDEEEEEKNEVEIAQGQMEEGEIRDGGDNVVDRSDDGDVDEEEDAETETEAEVEKMVEWSDADDEDDGGVGVEKGPIRSKNELQVLPLVPPVNAVLLPHHQPQPVGLISSVLGTQVIVEGIEKHNPLNEGSILWLTEKRSPLGLIDEIFGPVKNPFYAVRFNSESEAPEGISEGALISFVPEFAGFVLSDQNLYKKGYDASGENDEELSDEVEFSDDEKEAEYRRMQKMAKRVINGQTVGNNKKRNKKKVDERQREDWKNNNNNNKLSAQQTRVDTNQKPQNGNQHNGPPTPASNNINDFVPTSPPMLQQLNPGHFPGNWPNGVFPQHQHNPPAAMFGGFAPPLGNIQNTLHMVMQHILPFQQQFNPGQGSLPGNVMLPGPPPNFFPSSGFMPWSAAAPGVGVVNQGCFNQSSFGMGFLPQPTNPTMNMGDQRMMAVNGNMQSSTNISGNTGQSLRQNFNFGGMGFVPQSTNPVMNMGYQATTAINSNVQSSTNIPGSNVQSPQQSGNILQGQPPHNFSVDSDPGRKPVHRRGRGRFGGRGR
ncbi:unnamed protein product [Linum trigynum]|uniref:H/ACA ribonucleoprotein complex non-core subunit NAF1 n=1 Tax=Linum trigynum TaxID=586398 RepID=A0AAV2DJJ1_9ROSI